LGGFLRLRRLSRRSNPWALIGAPPDNACETVRNLAQSGATCQQSRDLPHLQRPEIAKSLVLGHKQALPPK
jgi:hypothetical protein